MSIPNIPILRAQHQDHLTALALKLTNNYHDAEDLLQDTWVSIVHHFNRFQPDTNFKAWSRTIMRNRFINQYRQTARRREILHEMPRDITYLTVGKTINEAELALPADDIYAHVTQLPDLYRIPFVLIYQGYKNREIAAMLQVPVGTVKSRVSTARKMLRGKIRRA
ncbi:MAG: RNA polymerase sigma factor [Bacteroidota bacterium]